MSFEKVKEMQDRLLGINRNGSIMKIVWPDGFEMDGMTVDAFIVVRADEEGTWVLWREAGYDYDGRSHIFKLHSMTVDDSIETKHDGEQWCIIDMVEDEEGKPDRKYHVEMLTSNDGAAYQSWRKWVEYKNRKADFFKIIDRRMIENFIVDGFIPDTE